MIRLFQLIVLLIALCSSRTSLAQSEDTGTDSKVPVSRFVAERRYSALEVEDEQAKADLRRLRTLERSAEVAKQCLEHAQLDSAGAERSIVGQKEAFLRLAALSPPTLVSQSAPWTDFQQAGQGWSTALYTPIMQCVEELWPKSPTGSAPTTPSLADEIVGTAYRKTSSKGPSKLNLASLSSFYTSMNSSTVKRSDLGAEMMSSVQTDLDAMTVAKAKEEFDDYKQQQATFVDSILSRVKVELEQKDATLLKNNKDLEALDKVLLNQKAQQSVLDQSLVWSIYGMIGALVVLFLSLRFLSPKIAIPMIENRSLVEVVSVAFILLTIIILGTGDRIGRESLGTLLGTIAGYVFGKKSAEGAGRRRREVDPQSAEPPSSHSDPPPAAPRDRPT